ncbi:MAG TPA: hypothetical protein ENH85_02775 [Candidatus Scalindua sp.]|nr:hypothetical protein [Candidatus Scalindua sp.]
MSISKFFCMLIAGLAIIGFTTIGLAEQEEVKQGEGKEAIESEVMEEGESASEVKAEAESKGEIQYGAEPEVKTEETETKAEEKE